MGSIITKSISIIFYKTNNNKLILNTINDCKVNDNNTINDCKVNNNKLTLNTINDINDDNKLTDNNKLTLNTINEFNDNNLEVQLRSNTHPKVNDNNLEVQLPSNIYQRLITYPIDTINDKFIKTENNIIIISMNLNTIHNLIDTIKYHKIYHEYIYKLLNIEKYKYLKIYENINDIYFFIINFNETNETNYTDYPFSLAVTFIIELSNIFNNNSIYIQSGISYDKLYYGLINNKLKLFGNGLILAEFLKIKANINKINKCTIVCCEKAFKQHNFEKKHNLLCLPYTYFFKNKNINYYQCYYSI